MLKPGAIWALGTMSGTSLDGVDAALLKTDGVQISEFGATAYRAYTGAERDVIRAALGCWPQDTPTAAAAEVVETAHASLLSGFTGADVIGFHGQTLAHDPQAGATHQAGDGQVLAEVLNLPVVSDFRSADMQLGGQGAPLAPFFHFACAKWIAAKAPIVFVNLGGVGNLTWVDPSKDAPEDKGALLAFDTGPANAPLDDLMAARLSRSCDEDGALALRGTADPTVVTTFLEDAYFFRMPPKSLDRGAFAGLSQAVCDLSVEDAAATLVACVVAAVARGMEHCPTGPSKVFVTGGGRKNPAIMAGLQAALNCPVAPVESVGLNGDMLEAQAFAYLAVRVARGLPTSCPSTTGVAGAVAGGRLSTPMV